MIIILQLFCSIDFRPDSGDGWDCMTVEQYEKDKPDYLKVIPTLQVSEFFSSCKACPIQNINYHFRNKITRHSIFFHLGNIGLRELLCT